MTFKIRLLSVLQVHWQVHALAHLPLTKLAENNS